ncbi:MAG: short-chain dehydrogenase [Rhizobiales bacterium PAR1]|nr:MAG: short-chain dehydrogenase [Rhizobiales bacterium PAR1]
MEQTAMKRLERKVALITGGGGGIGSAAGEVFCREGARVALIDMSAEVLNEAVTRIRAAVPGADVHGFVADLGREDEANRVVQQIVDVLGSVDILVNNVGIRRYDAVEDAAWDKWDDILRVNVLSYVSMVRAALPALRKSGRGSIVNVASTGAVFGRKGMAAYDSSKAALLALTRTIAHEEAEHGIRANTICPGYTRTVFHLNRLGEAAVDSIVPPCVMKRWADPKEMAFPLLWLASDEASYITGANIMVDGGYIGP